MPMGRAMSTASFSDRHFLSANILLAPFCGLVTALLVAGPASAQTKIGPAAKYAQFFSINETVIHPGNVIRLIAGDQEGDPDAEGAAYDDGYFYITGSHGRSRHHPENRNDSSYVILRFQVDTVTGAPASRSRDPEVVGVEASSRIRDVIKAEVPKFYDKPLDENGVNIEGIAVKDISVDAKAAFAPDQDLQAKARKLQLGPDTGIRDLAAVADGLLVLSGPVNDQPAVTPAVRHWDPKSGTLGPARELQVPDAAKQGKAETLLVLKDVAGEPWRVLVMFDGLENGAPTEYAIPR
jgi:hypothetical protein